MGTAVAFLAIGVWTALAAAPTSVGFTASLVAIGAEVPTTLTIDPVATANTRINAIDIGLQFDAEVVSAVDVAWAEGWSEVTVTIDNEEGTLRAIGIRFNGPGGVVPECLAPCHVFAVTWLGLADGASAIELAPTDTNPDADPSRVLAQGGAFVEVTFTPGLITVGSGPSPTATAPGTATTSPTATPIPSPTPPVTVPSAARARLPLVAADGTR